ncbi:unnamed protein product [Phyllotreta striolata]|uniref:Saposin B-type domain-containing protein n=1 Tax=Phyllotreta striolata TaxID=444603 RepID=A0A9N9TM14_PHYSR|nr:unnamed protein product [Phyllotreta striolata]
MSHVYTIFYLHLLTPLILLTVIESNIHPILPHHVKLVEDGIYAPFEASNFTLIKPKLVINPYKEKIQNFVRRKPFGSFCLKCAACVAIAREIVQTIHDSIDSLEDGETSIERINGHINGSLKELCQNGFKNYGLRKFNDDCIITDKLACTEYVHSDMDGSWTKKLREMCKLFVSYMDLDNILNDAVDDLNALPQKLCSGSGIFRDCVNVGAENYTKVLESSSGCNCRGLIKSLFY